VRRNRDDAGLRTDESIQIIRIAGDEIAGRMAAQERRFEHAQAGGHRPRAAVRVECDLTPARVFPVEDALEPHGQRGHAHLDEESGVVDRFGKRRRQHDAPPAARGGRADRIRHARSCC
jgi:hypothetical protein